MPKTKPRSRRRNKPRPPARSGWKRFLGWSALIGLVVTAALVLIYGFWASSYDISLVKEIPQRSTVFDINGTLYSRLQGENRVVVKRNEVSENFVEALLAREDSRFLSHRGVDPIGIIRATVRNVVSKSAKEGASTLTQQLARNTFPLGGKNLHRKILEAFVAVRIEQHYTKDEILEHYMNRIYFGAGVYGVETASLAYFGKHAKDLSLGESALLAGIIRAPTSYSPRKNLKGAVKQRDQVITRLQTRGTINATEAEAARQTPIVLSKKPKLQLQENYAMEAIRDDLDELLTDEQEADGGMKIYTTIDPVLQRAAEKALETQLRKIEQRPGYNHPAKAAFASLPEEEKVRTPYLQGAVVVLDHRDGGIRAIVGGRDFSESPYNRARESRRQIGSTFKPFVYAAAFQRGMLPGMLIDDGQIRRGEIDGASDWQPGNSDGTFTGPRPVEDGLVHSRNTMSVRVGQRAGLPGVIRFAETAGFESVPSQPAIYLGAFESTLAEVTGAYATLATLGARRKPYIIERIDDASGETIFRAPHLAPQVLDAGVCWLTNSALTGVMERGTGSAVKKEGFAGPCAGKTGTTNDYVDAWFVGFSSSLTCGVWVGLDQPKTIVSKGYGAALALPIWADVMAAAPKNYPSKPLKTPELRHCDICSVSNELATEGCRAAGTSYSADIPLTRVPKASCSAHRGRPISQHSELPAVKGQTSGLLRSFKKFFGGN